MARSQVREEYRGDHQGVVCQVLTDVLPPHGEPSESRLPFGSDRDRSRFASESAFARYVNFPCGVVDSEPRPFHGPFRCNPLGVPQPEGLAEPDHPTIDLLLGLLMTEQPFAEGDCLRHGIHRRRRYTVLKSRRHVVDGLELLMRP